MTINKFLFACAFLCAFNFTPSFAGITASGKPLTSRTQEDPNPGNVENSGNIGSARLVDTQNDQASTQSVFSPGASFFGTVLNDYHWVLELNLATEKTIKGIQLVHNRPGEAWSTSSSYLYPLVIFKDGEQLNNRYEQQVGPLKAGSVTLDLYGQIESFPFEGGKLLIEFTEGDGLEIDISDVKISDQLNPLDSNMSCEETPVGVKYSTNGLNNNTLSNYCLDGNKLAKAVCGGNNDAKGKQAVYSSLDCKSGCVNSACVAE